MEPTSLSLGKSVLDGVLGYAKSAFAEEVALQLGVQRDHAFIRNELEMMRAFLMAADEEDDKHMVVKTWVKQVRDVAYDAEDSLQDFGIRLGKPSWWCLPRTLLDRRRVAARMKELRDKVEDVSQRNVRYQLIKGSGSKASTTADHSSMISTVMSGTEEAMRQRNKAKMDLIRLIHNKKDDDLRVIAIWGTQNALGETSIVKRAYDDLKRDSKFECQALISITHPFNRVKFVQTIIRQILVDSLHEEAKTREKPVPRVYDLRKMVTMKEGDLIHAFKNYMNEKSFLIVLGDLSNLEDWDQIEGCFPTNKKGSRLVVCTEHVEIASLCVGKETEIPEHKQLSSDPTLFVFYVKDSRDGTYSMELGPCSSVDITEESGSANEKRFTRMGTMISTFMEYQLMGRMNEKADIIKLVSDNSSQELQVISIWGMGGLGKTTLVRHVYQSQELCNMFEKRACVTVKRPFDPNELLDSLATQLSELTDRKKTGNQQPLLRSILEGKKYLVVLDDLSSTAEWDAIYHCFPREETGSRIIVTTRVENIAKHCSTEERNIHRLNILGKKDAYNLFTEKVFGKITDLDEQYPELAEVAELILKKCNGLPLAIVTIGGFLSKHPKTPIFWRKLNEQIGVELEMNQELGTIKDILIKSYDGLPYNLKPCFLYTSIFPEDHNISRRRLVRRWIAEGYSSEVRSKSPKDIADSYFMELIYRSMILPFRQSIGTRKGTDSCQVHDLMREISISKSLEENLVFRMEKGCSSNTLDATRHLSISSNWEGDQSEFESIVDLSCIRSLTVFGRWRPFFISEKMRLLRVLDLEGTTNLFDHHLTEIGKLLHLKYLSLRGCDAIYHLPDSLGNLKQLQTLDIFDTGIVKLPQCIIKLRKLQYIRAGGNDILGWVSHEDFEERMEVFPKVCRSRLGACAMLSLSSCVACCSYDIREDLFRQEADASKRRDICSLYCHVGIPFLARLVDPFAVVLPSGIRKMKALDTLGVVNIARGKFILQDIRCLTQLRKLEVLGINRKNCQEFCSILDSLSCLESLSVRSVVKRGLHGCLDDVSSSPKSLQSLKLYGKLVKLPDWIGGLQNLVKLKLESTQLSAVDATMQLLGKLPNLAILRLLDRSFKCEECRLTFQREAPFPGLMVVELGYVCRPLNSVEFEEEAAPNLELLRFRGDHKSPDSLFSGLASLPKLREFQRDWDKYGFEANVQAQLAENPNGPILTLYSG